MATADHARFTALRQRRSQGRDLTGLFALMSGDRTGQRVEQKILAMIARRRRKIVIAKRGGKLCQRLSCVRRHIDLPSVPDVANVAVSCSRWQLAFGQWA